MVAEHDSVAINESELLECLRKIGKGMIASGSSVGVVENTLTEIANIYEVTCEVVALPNVLLIKVSQAGQAGFDASLVGPLLVTTCWLLLAMGVTTLFARRAQVA